MLLKQVWEVPREFYDLQRGQLPGVVKYSHDALWIQRLAGRVGHRQCHLIIRSHCPTVASHGLAVFDWSDDTYLTARRVSGWRDARRFHVVSLARQALPLQPSP